MANLDGLRRLIINNNTLEHNSGALGNFRHLSHTHWTVPLFMNIFNSNGRHDKNILHSSCSYTYLELSSH